MTIFANQADFDDPRSRAMATGVDLNVRNAITDPNGNVLAYAQTGGMIAHARYELDPGQHLFCFGGAGRSAQAVAAGGWWVEQSEFETLLSFAQIHDVSLGLAMRLLCLVPPEWSDASLLVRARVMRGLLAWRGLANSVVTPAQGGGTVRLPHQNEIAARRLHQLFIPGLGRPGMASSCLSIESDHRLDPTDSVRGFLYL